MKQKQFTKNQLARLDTYYALCECIIPQWSAPLWLLEALDRLLPNICTFNKAFWIGDTLVLYVPILCGFNPFYKALLQYRIDKYA